MVTLSPVGLAAAPVANQVSFLATFKEKLCRCVCATSTNQPFATVTYRNETQVINERFVVAFQGVTTLPASVVITQVGMTQGLIKIVCGKSNCYAINSSLTVSIAAPAA